MAASVLPTITMATTASTRSGSSISTRGSNSMPTDTKNSTAKASRRGSDSSAARALKGDSRSIMPAKKAPSANDTPNRLAAPNATTSATAITHRVKSSREPVRVTHSRTRGSRRRPTSSISAMKAATLARVSPTAPSAALPEAALSACNASASAGSSTSTKTITRSSTTSQPTAIRPFTESRAPRASSARSSTTVLATDSASPNTSAAPRSQPHARATPAPSAVATTICTIAPGTAMRRTRSRSLTEKCRPTPNISRITPISASCCARPMSATKPGVAGPMAMPAAR